MGIFKNLIEYYIVKQYYKISGLGEYQTGLQKISRIKYIKSRSAIWFLNVPMFIPNPVGLL